MIAIWLIIGMVWVALNGIMSKVDSDIGSGFFGILLGPIGPLCWVAGQIVDLVNKSK